MSQVTHGDYFEIFVVEIFQIFAEEFRRSVDPWMFVVGNAMELEDGDATVFRLRDGAFKIFNRPPGTAITGGWDKKRMVLTRFESESAAFFVRIFGRATATRKAEAEFAQYGKSICHNAVAGPRKGLGTRDAVFQEMLIHGFNLSAQAREIVFGNAHVIAGVIADFKAVGMELSDLLPGHVIGFVGWKSEAFADEKGGAKVILLQKRTDDGELRNDRIVERKDDEFIGNRFKRDAGGESSDEEIRENESK
jgi:hypothetical protein